MHGVAGPKDRGSPRATASWPRSGGSIRHIGDDMARPGSTRPCAPMARRRAVAAANASCIITAFGHERGGFGCALRTAITTCRSPPTGSTRNSPPGANQVWLADLTCVPTEEGWLYLAVVLDLFTRKIVGWAMRDHMRAELTIAALTMAIQRQKPPSGLTHHSDRGRQYAAAGYRKGHDAAGLIQSMSRTGNCWEHPPMERSFATLKTQLV